MLVCLLFSQGGYVLLFQYFMHKTDAVMAEHIDQNLYKTSDLVEIKIPAKLYYGNSSDDYQAISGQVKIKGICYNYVRLKIASDTLYMDIIPNNEKTRLAQSKNALDKQVADVPVNKKSHNASAKQFSDNELNYALLNQLARIPASIRKTAGRYAVSATTDSLPGVPGQPPEIAATLS